MIDIKEFSTRLKEICHRENSDSFEEDLVLMLVSNNWYGIKPVEKNGMLFISEQDMDIITERAKIFFSGVNRKTISEKYGDLLTVARGHLPETTDKLQILFSEFCVPIKIAYKLLDFLIGKLNKDLSLYNNKEIEELIKTANEEMEKCYFDLLCYILDEYRIMYKTHYRISFSQERRSTNSKEAYSQEFYSQIIYKLFCEEYIQENHMYKKALDKPKFARAWLYFALHLVNTVRDTDLLRIYHPILPQNMTADEVLNAIKHGTFTDADALFTLNSVVKHLETAPLTVNKTKGTSGVPFVHINVPVNAENLFGRLFAICEAHYQRDTYGKKNENETYFSPITNYEDICRVMGDDIGSLFIKENFSTISATKTVLQGYMMFGDMNDNSEKTGIHCKGYMLAAMARSHKGGYGTFAKQTATYLSDSKLNGMSPEFVAFELLSRGALSFVLSYMLRIITDRESDKLTVAEETAAIEQMGLTPYEANMITGITEKARKRAVETIISLYRNPTFDYIEMTDSLHRIANNEAPAAQDGCMCLAVAAKGKCLYDNRRYCIGCEYEISTQTTFLMMLDEFVRLQKMNNHCGDPDERKRVRALLTRVLTAIDEMLTCLRENYGEQGTKKYELIIQQKMKEVDDW